MANRIPFYKSVLIVVLIIALPIAAGVTMYGARLALGALWVDPICERACTARGLALREVDYRGGKHQSSSCICSNGAYIACHEADIVLGATTALVIVVLLAGTGFFYWLKERRAVVIK